MQESKTNALLPAKNTMVGPGPGNSHIAVIEIYSIFREITSDEIFTLYSVYCYDRCRMQRN